MTGKYNIGKQPCGDFSPVITCNGYADYPAVHSCGFCPDSTTAECNTCGKEHHANGYETCKREGL